MNCKPGDVAVVVRTGTYATEYERALLTASLGRIVTVVSVYERAGMWTWKIKEPFWMEVPGYSDVHVIGLDDYMLQPIRGDKAPNATESPKTLEVA